MNGQQEPPDGGRPYRQLYMLTTVGTQLVVSIVIGVWFGLWLDGKFGTKPWLMLLFLLFGVIAGFRNVYRMAVRESKSE
ncbi:MAG: AtpZ/AtpI family protein [Nitrospinae bacterium]|nr:AtpZ/AtpI family protein [Nitrospinota bacterium]